MYQKMYVWSKRLIIVWLIFSIFINFNNPALRITLKFGKLFMQQIINNPIYINILVDLLFISILWYICTRFDKVNELMQYLIVREEHGSRCTEKKPINVLPRRTALADNYKQTLWILM
ncbi:uncharacterized protein LOC113004025 [Solenopsis invicta]|uniref:uncharacterized protein LOC113004025 n=1 Tax=Solenopsis invicta TaxID=13686 RepID=UPI00193E37FF|nr:uncharacterized protein LOC113004025 [Solenopsis invicta]